MKDPSLLICCWVYQKWFVFTMVYNVFESLAQFLGNNVYSYLYGDL